MILKKHFISFQNYPSHRDLKRIKGKTEISLYRLKHCKHCFLSLHTVSNIINDDGSFLPKRKTFKVL